MKTLIPVDGSVYTTRLLDFVCKHRPLLGEPPELTLVTVVPSVPSHAANYLGHDVLTGYYQEQADAVLHPALATLRAAAEMRRQGPWRARPEGPPAGNPARRAPDATCGL